MSTASVTAINSPTPFGETMRAKLAGTSPSMALHVGWNWLRDRAGALIETLGIDRFYRWTRQFFTPKVNWVVGLASELGFVNITAYAATTQRGRELMFDKVPSAVYRVAIWPFRLLFKGVHRLVRRWDWADRQMIKAQHRGQAIEMFFVDKADRASDWLAHRRHSGWMRAVRSYTFWSMGSRMIRRFIPKGWMRLVAYALFACFPNGRVTNGTTSEADSVAMTVIDTALSVLPSTEDDATAKPAKAATDGAPVTVASASSDGVAAAPINERIAAVANRNQRRMAGRLERKEIIADLSKHKVPIPPGANLSELRKLHAEKVLGQQAETA